MKEEIKKGFEEEANKFYHKHEDIYVPEVSPIKLASLFNVEVAKVVKPMDYDMMLYNHSNLKKVIINPSKRKIATSDGEKMAILYGLFKLLYTIHEDSLEIIFANIERDNISYYLAKCFLLPEDLILSLYKEDEMISEFISNNTLTFNIGSPLLEERMEDISSFGQRGKVRLKKINLK